MIDIHEDWLANDPLRSIEALGIVAVIAAGFGAGALAVMQGWHLWIA